MKVTSGDVLERLIRGFSAKGGSQAQESLDAAGNFSRMLEEVVQKGPDGQNTKIDKDKLMTMLELIKVQMNQAVMSTLAGEDGEGAGGGFGFMLTIPDIQSTQNAGQEESKIRQPESPAAPVQPPGDLNAVIDKASSAYGVDKGLITSVIQAESDFDPNATSSKGAMGLMQLMPDTARGLGVSNAYDPEQNVMAGTRFLKDLLDRYHGDVRLALAAYNWGMGNLERSTSGRLPEETRNYIAKIMKSYGKAEG